MADTPVLELVKELQEKYGFEVAVVGLLVRRVFQHTRWRNDLIGLSLTEAQTEHFWQEVARAYPGATTEVVFHLRMNENTVLLSLVSNPTNDQATVTTATFTRPHGTMSLATTETHLWRRADDELAEFWKPMTMPNEYHVVDPGESAKQHAAMELLKLQEAGYSLVDQNVTKRLGTEEDER